MASESHALPGSTRSLRDRLTEARPRLRVEYLILVVVAYMMATANGSWWQLVAAGRSWSSPATWGFVSACFVALSALHFAVLAAVSHRWIVRPLLSIIVIVAAGAAYYMRTYGVILDPSMIQNVLRTDSREARDLLSIGMLAWVVAWSALPIAFVWWTKLSEVPVWKAIAWRLGSIAGAVIVAVLAILIVSRDFSSLMRNQREARYLVTPGNFLYGLGVNSMHRVADVNAPREVIGGDAKLVRVKESSKPRVLVLVIGETARAASFSLIGYQRETNPELRALDVTTFTHVTSCGTSTEVSLPCMFSPFGRADYDESRIRKSEGLLDVLLRAGYRVKWVDNQSGCKGVCAGKGIEVVRPDAGTAPDLCDGKECLDGILVRALRDELGNIEGDTVVVLHMMGNHGPAYFKRYSKDFRRFIPDCATAQLRDCSREEVVNSYDNAILYTDHVLGRLIALMLADTDRIDGALLYVSDHGESLGEKGLYLHGIPYAIAPKEQTHVPMILWLSPNLTQTGDVVARCVRARADQPYSHDHLFHSVLGLLDVTTSAYRPDRDLFAGCRGSS